ncbi:hypothetical protein M422DRAFT_264814 [Sphaerobolus stellatus SS14]|uniref:Uncharacterized protein n=1 Tax=Sphaerobolus stellatus (strain SS14) TaxID=990650 RepID=A0A0C9UEP1_SPHS4|nr:hypothetical protein M422DRAFT_264814 [Sphaerobolus stellatus SS14]
MIHDCRPQIYETLSKDIGLLITDLKSKRVKTYIRTEQIRDTISKYQGEIQTLRDNLMLYCNLSNTVQLFEVDRRVTSLVRERDMSVDEDFPELNEFRKVIQSDIILKENTDVELRGKDKSPSFIEYRAVALFNGKEYLTTTRTYEGESALERLKAELKLLARIRIRTLPKLPLLSFSQFFPAIIYHDDLPIDENEYERMYNGPHTISYLTQLYRKRRDEREAVYYIENELPSIFIRPMRDFFNWDCFDFATWPLHIREADKGTLRIYIDGNGRPALSLVPLRTNANDQDMEWHCNTLYSCPDNYVAENLLRQIEHLEKGRLDTLKSREAIISSLRALFCIIPYSSHGGWPEQNRVQTPYLGGIYHTNIDNLLDPGIKDSRHVGVLPMRHFPVEYDFRDVVDDPELDSLEPDEWEARTRTVKGLWLNFMPFHADKIKPLCITVNTRRKRELELWQINELNRDSLLAQFSHIAGRLKDCFQGNFNDLKLGLALVTGFYWYIKVWKPVKRANTSAVPDLYLFIDEPVIHKGAGRRGPDVYWSKCPDGTIRLTALEVYALGIERAPVIWCEPKYIQWNLEIVDMLRDFYESCGLSPCSDEVSHLLELPVPDYPELKQIKRRHSFAGLHQLKSSSQDEIRKVDKIDVYSWFWADFTGEMISLLPWVSSYISEEYRLFQEFNQRLGTRVAKYWVFLAAPELLPESLKVYDLRTTGPEFEYGGVGIDPVCRELPSRHWNFMKGDRWGEYDEQLSKLKCSLSM